jgi:hypothetical protein
MNRSAGTWICGHGHGPARACRSRKANGQKEDGFADWVAAENMLIRETFNRQLEATLSLVRSLQVGGGGTWVRTGGSARGGHVK